MLRIKNKGVGGGGGAGGRERDSDMKERRKSWRTHHQDLLL